jgi:hypothetical protein
MLAFSLLSGPLTVRLLGNASIGFRGVLGSLGADVDQNAGDGSSCPTEEPVWSDFYGSCVVACPAGQTYDNSGNCVGGGGGGAQPSQPSSGGSWWSQAITAFTKGAAQGALAPKTPTPTYPKPIAVAPWYTQWWGIGAIAVGVLGAGALILSPKKSTAVAGHRRR